MRKLLLLALVAIMACGDGAIDRGWYVGGKTIEGRHFVVIIRLTEREGQFRTEYCLPEAIKKQVDTEVRFNPYKCEESLIDAADLK